MKMIRAELEKKIVEIEEQAKQERLRQQEEVLFLIISFCFT